MAGKDEKPQRDLSNTPRPHSRKRQTAVLTPGEHAVTTESGGSAGDEPSSLSDPKPTITNLDVAAALLRIHPDLLVIATGLANSLPETVKPGIHDLIRRNQAGISLHFGLNPATATVALESAGRIVPLMTVSFATATPDSWKPN